MRVLLLVTVLLLGCVPKPVPVPWVGQIHVRGPEPTGRDPLGDPDLPPLRPTAPDTPTQARRTSLLARDVVTHRNSHWWQFAPGGTLIEKRPLLEEGRLDEDVERLRVWFADHGWADAKITWAPVHANATWLMNRQHTRFIDITFTVDPGPREVLSHADLFGARSLPLPVQRALVRGLPPAKAATSPARRREVLAALHATLENAHWPLARVWVEVAGPVEARVERYHVEPGETPPIGALTIAGTSMLHTRLLSEHANRVSHRGKPWFGDHLRWLARQIEAHPEVVSVTIQPEVALAADGSLPWTLRVVEAPHNSRRFTTSLSTSGALLALGFGVDWAHRGIGGGFASVSGVSRLGYRFFEGNGAAFFTGAQHGPATDHRVEIEVAPLPIYRVSLFASAFGALDTYRGYFQVRALGEAGLRWRPNPRLSFGVSYRGGYVWELAWPWQADEFARGFSPKSQGGLGLTDHNDLHALVLALAYDSTEHARLSTKGVKLALEGIPVGLTNGTPYHRLEGSLVWYASAVPDRLVLVPRLAFGFNETSDDGDQDGMLVNRFFLGGSGSMRGWGYHRLGPPGSPGTKGEVLPGGDAMLYASLEARFRLHPDLYLGTFFDVGRTWEAVSDHVVDGAVVQRGIHLQDLQPVAGVGGVGRTPLGGLEAWVGFQLLKDTLLEPEPSPVAFQFVLTAGW